MGLNFFMTQHVVVLPIMEIESTKLDVNVQLKRTKTSVLLLCIGEWQKKVSKTFRPYLYDTIQEFLYKNKIK